MKGNFAALFQVYTILGDTGKYHETCWREDGILVVIPTLDLGICTLSAANLTETFAQI